MLGGRLWPNGEVWAGHLRRPTDMGLSNLRKNHTPPRGGNGITSHGRRTVRQGAFLLEEYVGKSDLSFLTCTLPGATMEECKAANQAWSEIVRRFIQDLRRELTRKGAADWVIGCTEIQPKRYQSTGQPWPHLHLVFMGRTGRPWLIGPKRITALWARCVGAVLPITPDAMQWATRIEPIRTKKSVGQYLAKYMSKGGAAITEVQAQSPGFPLPRAWHHCSHGLNELIKIGTATLSANTSAWVIKMLQTKYPGCKLFAEILPTPHPDGDVPTAMGYFGSLDPPLAARVLTHNQKEKTKHD